MKFLFTLVENIARPFLRLFYRLARREWTEETFEKWRSFIGFLLVGALNTLVLFVVYYAIVLLLGERYYMLGQGLGYFAGIVNSYGLNSRYVFTGTRRGMDAFLRVCLCYLLTYGIQALLLFLFVQVLHISAMVAPIIAVVITTIINYFLNKFFAFQKTDKEA